MIKCLERDSGNRKLGRGVRATYREVGPTCPQSCEHLQNRSCYALYSFVNMHAKVSEYSRSDADIIYDYVTNLPEGKKLRHHVSGDFMKPGDMIDTNYIDSVLKAHSERPDLKGWTYTHAWERLDSKKMNAEKSLCVNASCDSKEEVINAVNSGWPATTVVDEDFESGVININGKNARLVVCPNQTHGISCSECMLCFRKNRSSVVAFRVHGTGKAKFNQK